jgi:hypothetical protein
LPSWADSMGRAPLVRHGIRPSDRVAVVGIGGVGHLTIQFSPRVRGASTIRRILKRHRIPPAPLRHTDHRLAAFLGTPARLLQVGARSVPPA